MRKIFVWIVLFIFSFPVFAFNQAYYNSLPSWDRYNVNLVKNIMPSVVNIVGYKKVYKQVYEYVDIWGGFVVKVPKWIVPAGTQPVSAWTAFFLTSNGVLVTNYHVIWDRSLKYKAITYDGKTYSVKVLAYSRKYDLALLKIRWKGFKPVKLINSNDLMIGQTVFAIWDTLGEFPYTVSQWIISGLGRSIVAGGDLWFEKLDNLIQTTAPINPGNSGGPLIDSLWNVVWINVAVRLGSQNVWFAIPVNTLKKWIYSLVR
jgi:serine protease Do